MYIHIYDYIHIYIYICAPPRAHPNVRQPGTLPTDTPGHVPNPGRTQPPAPSHEAPSHEAPSHEAPSHVGATFDQWLKPRQIAEGPYCGN